MNYKNVIYYKITDFEKFMIELEAIFCFEKKHKRDKDY